MRVCIVTVAGYVHGVGGMQEHTGNLVRGLVEAGHEVEVITARHPEGISRTSHGGGTWHFVDVPTSLKRLPGTNPAWHKRSTALFVQLYGERPFDVIHSEASSALGLLHGKVHHIVPTVVKFHGNYLGYMRETGRRMRAAGDLVREAKGAVWITGQHFLPRGNWYRFRDCEAMVPSYAQFEDTCRSHFLRRSHVHVVPNGIDTTLFSPRPRDDARRELGLGAGPLLLSVGRLERGKGVHHAIAALAMLPADQGARLIVVGDGEERASLTQLAAELGVAERVDFTGALPRETVATYLHAADVFVFPTMHPEAAPLVLPEAMGCGLPVVASRVGAIPEVVNRDGENGMLVPPRDAGSLAAALRTLIDEPERRRAIGEAARRRVLDEFTLERMTERTLAVYEIACDAFDIGNTRTGLPRRQASSG